MTLLALFQLRNFHHVVTLEYIRVLDAKHVPVAIPIDIGNLPLVRVKRTAHPQEIAAHVDEMDVVGLRPIIRVLPERGIDKYIPGFQRHVVPHPLDLAPQLPVHHVELLLHGHAVIEVYGRVLYIDPVQVSPVTLQLGPVLGTDHGEVA